MSRSRDDGTLHMFEVILVAAIMISAVAFVSTFETGRDSSPNAIADALSTKARDLLLIAQDTPPRSELCRAESQLDQFVVDAVSGRADEFREQIDRLVGPHVPANMYLSNGYGKQYLVKEFDGLASAAGHVNYGPVYSYAASFPQARTATGTEDLVIDTLAFRHSQLVRLQGEPVRTTVTLDNGAQHRIESLTALVGGETVAHPFAQNFTWLNEEGNAATSHRQLSLAQIRPQGQQVVQLRLSLDPPPNAPGIPQGVIPVGTSVRVAIPHGWTEPTPVAAGWTSTVSGGAERGWTVDLTLNADASATQALRVDTYAPTTNTRPFDFVHARLGDGSLGEATLVIEYPTPTQLGVASSVHATTPYPLRPGTSAVFGAAFANGAEKVAVTRVDIEIPGEYDLLENGGKGAELFAPGNPTALSASGGVWERLGPKHLRWQGWRQLDPGTATSWMIGVPITADESQATSIEHAGSGGVTSTIQFANGYAHESTSWGETPGVLRHRVPADDPLTSGAAEGYPTVPALGGSPIHPFTSTISSKWGSLSNTSSYTFGADATDLSLLESAIANASVRATHRARPLGTLTTFEVDMKSLVTRLAAEGIGETEITVDLYAPPNLGCAPTATWTRDASTLPLAAVKDLIAFDESGLGAPSVYVAADDNNVYRLTSSGEVAWGREMPTAPQKLAAAMLPTGPAVFVGTGSEVAKLDPLALGEIEWRQSISSAPLFDLLPDPTGSRLMAHGAFQLSILDTRNGDILAIIGNDHDVIGEAAWAEDGGLYATIGHRLVRLDAAYAEQASLDDAGESWFSLTPAGILVTSRSTTRLLDPTTLQPLDLIEHDQRVVMGTTGDATGDGVPDHVIVSDKLRVQVFDGTTAALVRTVWAPLPEPDGIRAPLPSLLPYMSWDSQGINIGSWDARPEWECQSTSVNIPENYREGSACVAVHDPATFVPLATAITAGDGHIALGYQIGSAGHHAAWSADRPDARRYDYPISLLPQSLWIGSWTPGTTMVLTGTNDGRVLAFDARSAEPDWETHPTKFVGRLLFNMKVPEGAFFGTHLLTVRLTWDNPVLGARSLTLVDWFDVVDPEGRPVPSPLYTLHLQLLDPSDPPRARPS